MSDSEATKINLAALRKVDSTISSIVEGSNQVALYKYLSEESRWEKTDIEGTLFVYVRSNKPQHGFMIMNRLSTTNLVEPITEKLEFQDQTPFLLYRNGEGDIYGIWFYEDKNCVKVYKLLSSLSQLAFNKSDKSNSIRQRSYSESNRKQQKPGNAQMDIISLLTRAQDEYDKKSAAKGTSKASKNNQHASNGDIVKPTPVRVNGATKINTNTPLTLGMLFAQAGGIEKKPNENAKDFDARVSSFIAGFLEKAEGFYDNNTDSFPIIKECKSFSPSQLLSPMDFTGPCRKKNVQPSLLSSSYSPEPGSVLLNGNGNSHEDLLNPQSLINGHIAGNLQPAGKLTVTPLNKDQFKEALIYMLQNDDAFVMQLHECYVKSLKTQLNSLNST
ncbi:mRNA-decapping enzyme 1B like protein [Argiope bruennichi]|uniref:mRNA-decapping enzyme 1B like protein n=1 Tax=Argiope bruennichi TaxID=94029 RepID=A0A8T0ET65_ARGBR|nr:mRNA-decapping enzyme 1B like protein [Argiope bruennichi]